MPDMRPPAGGEEGRVPTDRGGAQVQEVCQIHNVSRTLSGDSLIHKSQLSHCLSCRSEDLQIESVTETCKKCELPIHVKNLVDKNVNYLF